MKTKINILSVLCVLFIAFVNGFSSTEQIFYDNFESSMGWVRNFNGTDNATTGLWERDDPEGTFYGETMQLNSTVSGTKCLVTAHLSGDYPGTYDIDDGVTTVRSPAIQLPSDGNLTLSFYYNFAHYSNATSADYFRVKIIGNTTVQVLEVLGSATVAGGIWKTFSANLNSFKGQSIYILIEAADDAEPSLVEAAVEDVSIVREIIVPPGEEDSLVVTGKIMLHPYNNDTARAVQLYGNYQTEPEDHISFEIQVPPTLNPSPQRYTFDDLAFRTTADINTTANMICNDFQCYDLSSSGNVQCLNITAQNSINCQSIDAGELITPNFKSVPGEELELSGNTKIDGVLWARKVTVTLDAFPDHVFTKSHSLKSLSEIEKYIKEHGSLPGLPSESEVKKKGIELGEISSILVEKIEEMTLHMISLEKKNKALEAEINFLKNK